MTCNQTSTKYAYCDKVLIESLFQNTIMYLQNTIKTF